jgi:hypothetical protein
MASDALCQVQKMGFGTGMVCTIDPEFALAVSWSLKPYSLRIKTKLLLLDIFCHL